MTTSVSRSGSIIRTFRFGHSQNLDGHGVTQLPTGQVLVCAIVGRHADVLEFTADGRQVSSHEIVVKGFVSNCVTALSNSGQAVVALENGETNLVSVFRLHGTSLGRPTTLTLPATLQGGRSFAHRRRRQQRRGLQLDNPVLPEPLCLAHD